MPYKNAEMAKKQYQLLTEIRRVMQTVADLNKPIQMNEYFFDDTLISKSTTVSSCNTPACVAGYASLDKKVMNLVDQLIVRYDEEIRPYDVIISLPDKISIPLTHQYPEKRQNAFDHFFPAEDINQFEHLLVNDPRPEKTVQFIDFLLDKFKPWSYHKVVNTP